MINISPFGKHYTGKCYKRGFSTKKAAKQRMKRSKKKGQSRLNSTYQCKQCKMWHLSHLTQRQYSSKVVDYKLIDFLKMDLA